MPLTSHEIELLQVMAGEREPSGWGAWVSVCLEALVGGGYITRGPNHQITDAGRAVLDDAKRERAEGEVMGA